MRSHSAPGKTGAARVEVAAAVGGGATVARLEAAGAQAVKASARATAGARGTPRAMAVAKFGRRGPSAGARAKARAARRKPARARRRDQAGAGTRMTSDGRATSLVQVGAARPGRRVASSPRDFRSARIIY